MKPKRALAAALAMCAGVLWIAVSPPQEVEPGVAAEVDVRLASRAAGASRELDGSNGVLASPGKGIFGGRSQMPAAASPRVQTVEAKTDASPPGRLILRAVDRETRAPLGSFTVRLASAMRFAEERHDDLTDELALPLTPATYAGLVTSPGYEPAELTPVRVGGGETVRLAAIELSPGSGSIVVAASGADVFDGLSVELRGFGRRPCARCLEAVQGGSQRKMASDTRCPSCGFARDDSSRPIGRDGRVEFTGLAHGPFALRVVDALGRTLGDESSLDLGLGEAATVLFDVSQWRTIEVKMFDTDGVSLSSEWSRRLAVLPVDENILTLVVSGDSTIPIRFEMRRDVRVVAQALLLPPTLEGMGISSFAIGCRFQHRAFPRPTADRERTDADSLWPLPTAPHFEPAEVTCELDGNGIAILAPLSTSQLELHVAAQHLVAEALVPSGRGPTRVRVQLQSSHPVPSGSPAPTAATYRALESQRHR